ncbi:4043_t:CDS:1, partial [Paraglomus occultum]
SYRWDSPPQDGCCVKMCNGGGEVGYWCPSHSNGVPSSDFDKVVIGCNEEQLLCS